MRAPCFPCRHTQTPVSIRNFLLLIFPIITGLQLYWVYYLVAQRVPGLPEVLAAQPWWCLWRWRPAGVLHLCDRAEQSVSLQQRLPGPSGQDFSAKPFGAFCWPGAHSASGCKTLHLGAISLCSVRTQAASPRPAELLIPPLTTSEKSSFLPKNLWSCTPIYSFLRMPKQLRVALYCTAITDPKRAIPKTLLPFRIILGVLASLDRSTEFWETDGNGSRAGREKASGGTGGILCFCTSFSVLLC